jgi:hypothetical protein
MSSATSIASAIDTFFGEWNCDQSRSATNVARIWRSSATVVVASVGASAGE